jgi:hypothetical protein
MDDDADDLLDADLVQPAYGLLQSEFEVVASAPYSCRALGKYPLTGHCAPQGLIRHGWTSTA